MTPTATRTTPGVAAGGRHAEVVVVGGGFSGLAMAIRLREAGVEDLIVLERASDVGGTWEAAANPRLAVLRGLQPGRYTVVVEPALADASGKALNRGQHGPVYVI